MTMLQRAFGHEHRIHLAMSSSRDETFAVPPKSTDDIGFYGFVPSGWTGERWVVSIHGYTRNAAAHITQLACEAVTRDCALIAPIFPKATYPRFHKLGPSAEGTFPEAAFESFLETAAATLSVNNRAPILGYSGGGQFLHRAMMMRPGLCDRAVLFAPGWYTWPAPHTPYPYGTGSSTALGNRSPRVEHLRSVNLTVLVGSRDTRRDGTLNTKQRIDRQQGMTRVERAERWVVAMNEKLGRGSCSVRILLGLGHDFTRNIKQRGLAKILFDELLNSERGATHAKQN